MRGQVEGYRLLWAKDAMNGEGRRHAYEDLDLGGDRDEVADKVAPKARQVLGALRRSGGPRTKREGGERGRGRDRPRARQ